MPPERQRTTRRRPQRRPRRLVVVLAMLIAALSLWTAIPLTWIYIGSRLSDTQFPSGGPYMLVFVGIVISILIIAWLLGRLNGLYVRITGTNTVGPIRPAWLKSMRDTPTDTALATVLEAVIVGSVLLAVLAMTAWFFLWPARRCRTSRASFAAARRGSFAVVRRRTCRRPAAVSPSTSILPPRRRSQTRSVWTADSLTPPDSG